MTYTQEQLNAVSKSYEQDLCRIALAKANVILEKDLTILNLRTELAKKEKQIIDLEKQLKPE